MGLWLYINQKIKWIIIGIGLNLQKSPTLNRREFRVTSLKQENIHIDKNKFIDIFLETFFINYELWKKKGFSFIKKTNIFDYFIYIRIGNFRMVGQTDNLFFKNL